MAKTKPLTSSVAARRSLRRQSIEFPSDEQPLARTGQQEHRGADV